MLAYLRRFFIHEEWNDEVVFLCESRVASYTLYDPFGTYLSERSEEVYFFIYERLLIGFGIIIAEWDQIF